VLTAWKEREPGFIRRRERIETVEGSVPAYADDRQVADLAADEERETGATAAEIAPEDPAAELAPGAVATVERTNGDEPGDGEGEGDAASAERRQRNAERRAKRQARRKHGRNR
jgi:hypothetical protein